MIERGEIRHPWVYALMSMFLPAVVTGITVAAVYFFGSKSQNYSAELELPIVLIATVLAILGGLSFLVIVLSRLGLTTPDAALGMPEGSIRAVIAISLLFLFMIVSIFLYVNLSTSSNQASAAAAPDIAKQLVTTVATLAVSVAGFYFGTSAVTAAAKAVSPVTASLRLVSPTSPASVAKGSKLTGIRVAASPSGTAVNWRVEGDDPKALIANGPYDFEYAPSATAQPIVTVTFSLDSYPDVTAQFVVNPK